MMRRLKIIALAATLAGFGVMSGVYDLGFDRWPPHAILADGQTVPLGATEVQTCFKARALALLGDRAAGDYWDACQDQLALYGALDVFDLRSLAVAGGAVVGLLALLNSLSAFASIGLPSRSRAARGFKQARQG